MVKKNLLLFIILLVGMSAYSQSTTKPDPKETIFKTVQPGKTETVTINITGYDMNNVGELKDILIGYTEKVISVDLNENTKIMKITYNEFMLKQDFINAFIKNGIDYFVHTTPQPLQIQNN